jgi:hypothetical protein
VLFCHEHAFVDTPAVLAVLAARLGPAFRAVSVPADEVSYDDAVATYLFNSQLLPRADGRFVLIAPADVGARPRVAAYLERLAAGDGPIAEVQRFEQMLADEGVLLVTVVNDLDEPVSGLRLVLTPGNARMRVVETPASVDIEARSKASVPVRLAAVAQGVVPFSALLTTRTGAPVGVAGTIEVRAAPPGAWLYVAFGGALGVILVVGVVRSLRRPSKVQTDIALDPVEPTPEPPWPPPLDPT